MTNSTEPATPTITLKRNTLGVPAILFFVFSAQAPLTGIVGAVAYSVALGNGAGAPGAYLLVGLVIILFAVGFTTISRHIDTRGGFYPIVQAGLGRGIGTGGAFLALWSYNTIQAAMYGLLGATLAGMFPAMAWWIYAVAAIAVVWALGTRGIELGARVLSVLVIAEVAILLAFSFVVLVTTGWGDLDIGASFAPSAIAVGTPGVAILFAIASMFGFESTAIYSGEARDPRRTVPRATYLSVVSIAIFFAFVVWMIVAYYGSGDVQDAALATLADDPAMFVLEPLTAVLGPWAATAAQILLCTSLLAGVLAFHNMVTRYVHSLADRGYLPRRLAHTNDRHAPAAASLAQTVVALILVMPFAIAGLDPSRTLFAWFSGVAVAALVLLYVLSSVAIVVYFRRTRVEANIWTTLIAPVAATVLMVGELYLIVTQFGMLTGSTGPTGWLLLATVPVMFLAGCLVSRLRSGAVRAPAAISEQDA
ncbi:APC family permease [Millisia brevis]|uniref:APC family permease n=1 Tax=Millisia brevis TaxID=264148 RepID=UPI0008318F6E|nr:APC family permease [Millisia brevis]